MTKCYLCSSKPKILMTVELRGHYGYRRIVRTMAPMVATMVVVSVYSIVDGFFISNYAGSTAFAAMNLIWPVIALVAAVGLMLGAGGSALVSKLLGEANGQKACAVLTLLVRTALAAGLVMAVALFVFMRPVCLMLGASPEMLPYAITYGRIIVCILPLNMVQLEFQSFYMSAERPQLGTAMSIASGVVNIALDALFIVGFGWGLTGAAIATALAMALGGLFPIFYFSSRRNTTHLRLIHPRFGGEFRPSVPTNALGDALPRHPRGDAATLSSRVGGAFRSSSVTMGEGIRTVAGVPGELSNRRIDWRSLRKACTNGLSEFVGNIAFNLIAVCYNLQLMKYIGENGVSAYGIIMYVGFIFGAVFIGYNTGISQVIAYNFGADNREEMRSLLRKSLALIGIGGLVMTVLSEGLAPVLAQVFVGYDEELCALTCHACRLYMLSFLICGFNMFTSAWFTALNNGVVSAVAAFTRSLVFELAAILILPALLGIDGIWLAVNAAEILALILSAVLFFSFGRV